MRNNEMSTRFYVRLAGPMRAVFACLSLSCLSLMSAEPAEAQQLTAESKLDKLQAGFYRMKIGTIDVIALSDGTAGFEVLEMLSKPKEAGKFFPTRLFMSKRESWTFGPTNRSERHCRNHQKASFKPSKRQWVRT